MIDKWIERLPSYYRKESESTNYKFLKIFADQTQNNENNLKLISDWIDIDKAEGKTLDRIGKDFGQPRNGLNDKDYRPKIKTKIRANLSGGEIETLNGVCRALFGAKRFGGLQEGWTLSADFPIGPEPAMVLFTVHPDGNNFGIPMKEIDNISAGGVRTNWQLSVNSKVELKPSYTKHEQKLLFCGMFKSGEDVFF